MVFLVSPPLSIPFHSHFSSSLLSVRSCSNTWALMANFAVTSSDLNKSSSSKKRKVTSPTSSPLVTNEKASAADVEGRLNMPNQGMGDTNQIGQSSTKEAGKRPRKEADAKHYNKKKMMLEDYKEMTIEVEKLRAECENSRKYQKLNDEKMEEVVGIMKENRSLISSLNATIQSQNQHMEFLFAKQLDLYKENDQLKKENEFWKNLYTQRQPVDPNCYDQNMSGHSQPVPIDIGGSISQQPHVNSNFPGQFQSMLGHSQPMATDRGGSVFQTMQPRDDSFYDDLQRLLQLPSEPL